MRKPAAFLLLGAIAGLTAGAGMADSDHEEAYRLRQKADILPLERIFESAGLGTDARILEVEAEFEEGRSVYEIEYVAGDGRVMEVVIDARTGAVLKRREER
jgi:uncharacterized membrane protein YkoI